METKTLSIGGMTCAACARRVEKVIGALDGVCEVSVNLATEKATVAYEASKLRRSAINEAVEKAGYKVLDLTGVEKGERNQNEIQSLRRKLAVAASFAIPLLYIAMAPMLGMPFPGWLDPMAYSLLYGLTQLFLVLPIMVAGGKFYIVGFKALWQRSPNMDSLVAVGTSAAFIYSAYNVIQIARGNHMAVEALYFESTGIIIALILLGKTLETLSKGRTGEAIKKLVDLAPKTAIIIRDNNEVEIPVDDIEIGDIIVVKPGAKFPADGTVLEGQTSADESMLSGESMPVDKIAGDKVYAASLNINGTIRFCAEKVGGETALSRIIRLVEDAQGSKAPIAKLADTVSGYFVPIVCAIAAAAGAAWFLATGGDLEFSLTIFISTLVIACPCALGLATPTAIMVGTGKGAENGILIKSGEALEAAYRIDTIIFDKTGTVTEGKPTVTDVIPFDGVTPELLLQITASAEKGSEHPLGQAIVRYTTEKGVTLSWPERFEAIAGRGIEAVVDGRAVLAGNRRLMDERNVVWQEMYAEILAAEGKTPMYVAIDEKPAGIIAVADTLKATSIAAVKALRAMGIEIAMITGDNKMTALAVAKQAGIDRVLAEVMPEDKAGEIKRLQLEGRRIAMVGDGINDAPALMQAEVGIAIGTGADIAIESADVVLMRSDLMDVVSALELSKKTMRTIKENLFWAFGYNVIGIPVAAGLLYIFGGPLLNPMIAAAAMSLSSVSVLANALRLRGFNTKRRS